MKIEMKQQHKDIYLCECGNNSMWVFTDIEVDPVKGEAFEVARCDLCGKIAKIYWKWDRTITLKEIK